VFKVEDSNIEGIGTDLDKGCRKTAASTEKAWKKVKKDKVAIYVWRIEKFKVKANLDAKNGLFYDDDSYIVLNVTKDKDDKIHMDIHFWLGKTTSQDEKGTAAYKTVELDDFMDGAPIQHRETSGFESRMFLKLYPHGIRLLHGGCASGFNHVEPESFKARLLHIKGKKHIRVVQVPIKIASLNSGDVFVLDTGMLLYQYQGRKCGKSEKLQAGKLMKMIDDERKGKPEKRVFSQIDKPDDDIGMFLSYFQDDFGGDEFKEGEVVPEDKCIQMFATISTSLGGSDEDWEKQSDKVLFQLSDESGELKFQEVAKGKIARDNLDSNDVFVFDIGREIFVWIGSGASESESKKAMHYATKYLADFDRPAGLPVTKFVEGGETGQFNSAFDS